MPSSTDLDLPFTYEAAVLPGHRHTRAREVTLRANAIVEVPHLSEKDFTKVVDLAPAPNRAQNPEEGASIYQRGGRLFSPLTVGGRRVEPARLSEALANAKTPRHPWQRNGCLDSRQFPVEGQRHRRDGMNALRRKTLGEQAISDGWPAPRVVRSNYDEALAASVGYLMDALAIVDGHVWAECSEPVWEVRHVSYHCYSLVFELWPTALRSHASFRLDQRDRALEYAAARNRRIDPADQDPPAEILDKGAITRIDLTEVGAATLIGWPWLRHRWQQANGIHQTEETVMLHQLQSEGRVAMHDVPTVMNAISALLDGPGADLAPRARNHEDVKALFEGVRRWRYEEASLDPSQFDPMHDADWQALQGLV